MKAVAKLNASLEAEWQRMRNDSKVVPSHLVDAGKALLADWGLAPKGERVNDEDAIDLFRSSLDDGYKGWVEDASPAERKALELLYVGEVPSLEDALTFYLSRHHKGEDESFSKTPKLSVDGFISAVGDKPFTEITRDDVRKWMDAECKKGLSAGTVQRRLNALNALASYFIRERELDIPNRFSGHCVPRGAKPAKERKPFSIAELITVQKACRFKDDDMRHLVAILSDTCSRLSEIAGLRLHDIVLDHDIPHIRIASYAGRSLKTSESNRSVPLVGQALWAAQRVVACATGRQVFAFPRYAKDGKCRANLASASLNKWIKSLGMIHTTHDFRHTMADRLREVACPEEIRLQIGGWARGDLASKYGEGYSLRVTQSWLKKTVLDLG